MDHKVKIYFTGIAWFVMSLFSSTANDVISKYTGASLHPFQVAFFRFFFSALSLLPFIIYYGKDSIKTSRPFVHFMRGLMLFLGMTAWTYGLVSAPVTTATVISFSIPLFTLVLATVFLDENIIWQRWLVTLTGFIGIIITLNPSSSEFNPEVLIFVIAAAGFAGLDIINKKFIIKESMISMLFYSASITAALSAIPAFYYWQTPAVQELVLLAILGMSANLILFFLLKAFSLIDATAVAPYRYLELFFSSVAAYVIFDEIPQDNVLYGALVIIPSTLFITYSEQRELAKKESLNRPNP